MIRLSNVTLRYPLLSPTAHSLQRTIYGAVGGLIGRSPTEHAYVEALRDVTLTVPEGCRLGILGHNGAGKTTLLRLISGIYPPTRGKVIAQGRISALTDITLGMEPQESGLKNIFFRLVFMGYDFASAKAAVDEIVDFTELGDFIHLPVHTYSTGMYLRLAFAVATHFPPDILILDEVIGAGDEAFRAKARARMEAIIGKARIVVLSSHDLGALEKYCDRAILLDHGAIAADGSVKDVIAEYAAKAVA